jgi:hypothetical protein
LDNQARDWLAEMKLSLPGGTQNKDIAIFQNIEDRYPICYPMEIKVLIVRIFSLNLRHLL